ncbi:uncharacterized protein METZ01_LOCUS47623, partial [marine metagenome]
PSSGVVKKKLTAQGDGLSRDTANASTTTLVRLQHLGFDRAHPKGTPANIDLYYFDFLNHYL